MTSRLHHVPSLLLVGLTLLLAGCNGTSDYLRGRGLREESEPEPAKQGSKETPNGEPSDPSKDDTIPPGEDLDPNDPKVQAFVKDVKPIFERRCAECHHAGKDLDLTKLNPKATMQKALATTSTNMPPSPREKMSADEIAIVKAYVDKL